MKTPTLELVLAKIKQTFPQEDPAGILALLREYTGDEAHRVHLALLKLSAGNRGILRNNIKMAVTDYRDVLVCAEYSGQMREDFSRLPHEEQRRIEKEDLKQYQDWLNAAAYAEMAADERREAEALEWSEATIGDVADEKQFSEAQELAEAGMSDYLSNLEDYEERLAENKIQW